MLTYLDTAIGFIVVMLAISLLITILTQMVSALVNHRGSNLQWGLKTLFANIDPGLFPTLKQEADPLASEVLKHCLISDSWFSDNRFGVWLASKSKALDKLIGRFQLASAIRPNELVSILRDLAAAKVRAAAAVPAPANAATLVAVAANINALLATADPIAQRDMQMVAAAVGGLPGGLAMTAPAAVPLLQDAVNTAGASVGHLESWFGSVMDRVSQKFAMYMRLWTVAFACLFALITGLNTMDLVAEIYHNGVLRDSLVGAGQQMTATAATVLDPQNSLSAKYSAALLAALAAQGIAAPIPAPVIATTVAGTQWITDTSHVPAPKTAAVLSAFNDAAQTATQKFLADNKQTADSLLSLTSKAGVNVVKLHWPSTFIHWQWPAHWWPSFAWRFKYLLGVFLTAALLSLGAPFWFNSLKQLANLRPILASKQDAQGQGANS
jgi:hypothetical protein